MNSGISTPPISRLPRALFALSAIVLVVSFFCPAFEGATVDVMPGWEACVLTFYFTVFPWIERPDATWLFIGTQILLPLIMGTYANLTYLASAIAGFPLRRRAPAFCGLSMSGLLAGLLMPLVMALGGWCRGSLREVYVIHYYGYWMWIASLALLAAGWAGVVWHQRHFRPSSSSPQPSLQH